MIAESVLDADELARFECLRPMRDKRRLGFSSDEWRAFGFTNSKSAGYWLQRVRGRCCECGELPYLECGPVRGPAPRRPHPESMWRW